MFQKKYHQKCFFIETIPVNLSIEEQNVKNSIMRLNEKLNSKNNFFFFLF